MTTDLRNLEIVRTLGVGGMATVYLARTSEGSTSRHVAVKKPHAFLAEDPASAAVIEDEAQLAACIRHPNVVRVLDFVPASAPGEAPALVMEWIEGVDLGKLVQAATKAGRRLPIDVVAAIARDVLAGLHAAHESRRDDGLALDIVHRDVSPQNVLVGFDGVVRVTDFGVAKAASRLQQQTEAGSIKGKLAYLAPEQLAGRCDRRVDVYGAGVIVWELLTGTRMRGGDGLEMLVEIMCSRASAPSSVAPDAACLDAVVMRALAHREEDRFATAEEMLQAIERQVTAASPARVADFVRELMGVAEPVKVEAAAAAPTIIATLPTAIMPTSSREMGGTASAIAEPYQRQRCVKPGDENVAGPLPGALHVLHVYLVAAAPHATLVTKPGVESEPHAPMKRLGAQPRPATWFVAEHVPLYVHPIAGGICLLQ